MSAEELYSIKMRASKKENGTDVHISGAEKIVEAPDVDIFANALIERGMHHSKGEADALNLKINKVCKENIIYLDALSVETIEVETWEKGQEEIKKYLKETGIDNPQDVMQFLDETYAMRGAMLLDVDRLIRLEPDKKRGIRATNMDQERMKGDRIGNEKNHYEEAIVLATKVANCPGIIGEICISDDPEYVTGYVSSKEIGYRRITKMKRMGSEKGGRIFLFRGTDAEEQKAIDFLQNQHVIVRNVPKKICKKSDMKRPQKWDKIDKALVSLKENHLFRTMKTIESAQSSHVTIDGKDYVLMASNNYLDIASHPEIAELKEVYTGCGYPVIFTSAKEEENISELKSLLKGKTTSIAGPSGVGKSSLINLLQSEVKMETGSISKKIDRGKHTTRHSELIVIGEESYIMDTPGFSSLYVNDFEKEDLKYYFPEFTPFEGQCKFNGCDHIHEPGCAVKEAVEEGKIHKIRYEDYTEMYRELKERKRY